jgi:hypothetical protein
MQVKIIKFLSLLLIIFIVGTNCKSYKYLNSYKEFKGTAEILNKKYPKEESTKIKFVSTIDSLKNVHIKLYTFVGFKIGDLELANDSLKVVSLYDDSYKDLIINEFDKYNSEIFMQEFIRKLFNGTFNEKREGIPRNSNCKYLEDSLIGRNEEVVILNRKCYKLFSIKKIMGKKIKRSRNYEIIISKDLKINLEIKDVYN